MELSLGWLWLLGCSIFALFAFVIAFGAPYLPTLKSQVEPALDLIDLQPGQTLLELGSGDGRVLRAAAERGINAIGYELNPLLVMWSRISTLRYRRLVRVRWGNYWHGELPAADGIFVFLLKPYMAKLDKKITQEFPKGVKLVSFAFQIQTRKPTRVNNGLFLYVYPPRHQSKSQTQKT